LGPYLERPSHNPARQIGPRAGKQIGEFNASTDVSQLKDRSLAHLPSPGFALLIGVGTRSRSSATSVPRTSRQAGRPQSGRTTMQSQGQSAEDRRIRRSVARAINGPRNHRCSGFGLRVVVLMWRDDLDTSFSPSRPLRYDRFLAVPGATPGDISLFGALGAIDPKAPIPRPDT